jgi:branched-chain amino acid transport system substrate-binding protein
MTRLLEELMVQEKVDFILPPWSTAMLFAAAPIANKYHYILVGGAGGAASLENLNLPYFFQSLNFTKTQIPALADILAELGVKKAAIFYIEDLHGTEYSDAAVPAFESKGIEVVVNKSYPFLLKDAAPLLQEAQSLGADAFIGFSYPEDSILITGTAIAMGTNFKTFFLSVCPAFTFYKADVFGPAVEGVMGGGAWNEKSTAGAKAFSEHYTQVTGQRMGNYWGSIYFYSAMQHFVQAVEEAGTLNQSVIREVMAEKTYPTALGDYWYDEKQLSASHPGEIGQWQGDVFEVVDPGAKRTAPPILKPDWPKQ